MRRFSVVFVLICLVLNLGAFAETGDPNAKWTIILKDHINRIGTQGYTSELKAEFLTQIPSGESIQKSLYTKIMELIHSEHAFDEAGMVKAIEALKQNELLKSWPYAEMVFWESYCIYNDTLGISSALLDGGYNLLTLADAQKDQEMKGKALLYIGKAYYYMISDDKAKEYLDQSVVLALENQDYLSVAMYNYTFADTYYSYGDFEIALNYGQEGLDYLKKDTRKALIAPIQFDLDMVIARSKYELGEKALSYDMIDVLEKSLNPNNKRQTMWLHSSRAKQYYFDALYEKALVDIKKAVALSTQLGEDKRLNSNHNSMLITLASTLYHTGDFEGSSKLFVTIQEANANQDENYVELAKDSASVVANVEENIVKEQIDLISSFERELSSRIEIQKKFLIALGIGMVFLVIIIVLAIVDMRFKSSSRKKLYLTSITDGLTQISNRSHIIEIFESRLNKQIVVAMLDVDYFKKVNDTFGHVVGDEVLIGVVDVIKKSIREQDFVGRYGGEEFLIIFDGVSYDTAIGIVERLRENIAAIKWEHEGLQTTVSLGMLGCSGKMLDGDAILRRVDALMYEAKRTGRNKVVCALCTEGESDGQPE